MRRQFPARDRGGAVLRADVLTRTEAQAIRRVPAATLRAFLVDALRACGLNDADAATVASAMLEADVTGSDAHGVFRLAGYVRALKRGAMNPRASIRVLERGPASAGSVPAARITPAPARPMPPFRSSTAWSESTARLRA